MSTNPLSRIVALVDGLRLDPVNDGTPLRLAGIVDHNARVDQLLVALRPGVEVARVTDAARLFLRLHKQATASAEELREAWDAAVVVCWYALASAAPVAVAGGVVEAQVVRLRASLKHAMRIVTSQRVQPISPESYQEAMRMWEQALDPSPAEPGGKEQT